MIVVIIDSRDRIGLYSGVIDVSDNTTLTHSEPLAVYPARTHTLRQVMLGRREFCLCEWFVP